MFEINSSMKSSFISRIHASGFTFSGKKISLLSDVRYACDFIYNSKHVLYKTRSFAQRYALKNPVAKRNLVILLDDLANKIYDYFNAPGTVSNNQGSFDAFFCDICTWFVEELNENVRMIEGLAPAYYGNAQKMINILFKYLCCFDDYPKYADLFSYCHIPIDNEILGKFMYMGIPSCTKAPRTKWFKGKGWYEFDKDDYWDLVEAYRHAFSSFKNPNLPYLAVDFAWWGKRGLLTLPTTGISVTIIASFHA